MNQILLGPRQRFPKYPYWNQTVIPDDFGNLIPAPSFQTKMFAILRFYSIEIF